MYASYEVLPVNIIQPILENINKYLYDGNELTSGMNNLITSIIQQGNEVEKKEEDGQYLLTKNKK